MLLYRSLSDELLVEKRATLTCFLDQIKEADILSWNFRNRYGEDSVADGARLALGHCRAAVVALGSIGLPLNCKPKSMQHLDSNAHDQQYREPPRASNYARISLQ